MEMVNSEDEEGESPAIVQDPHNSLKVYILYYVNSLCQEAELA